MRLPRFRFSVRRIMLAVAIASILLAPIARNRSMEASAKFHLAQASACMKRAGGAPMDCILTRNLTAEELDRCAEAEFRRRGPAQLKEFKLHRYHVNLYWKYHDAARHPWLPVAPDPPEPQ